MLPWRSQDGSTPPTPYAVWISEIMLQQTQVSVVIPFFLHWMQQFKNVEALAKAPLDTVIKAWEGLGYYSRARNLQKAAQYLVEHTQGKLPSLPQELLKLPGIGPYTVGAIRSFAFHQKAAAIDGNVVRVMSRYLGIADTFTTQAAQRTLEAHVLALLPDQEPWVVMEALIELGATVCRKKAECYQCPLRVNCHAYLHDQCEVLPIPKKRAVTTLLERDVVLVICEDAILVRRCGEGKVMSDLHEFPSHIRDEEGARSLSWLEGLFEGESLSVRSHKLVPVKHSYTRYRVTLHPHMFECERRKEIEGFFWQPLNTLHELAFSAGHRQLAAGFYEKKLNAK